MQNCLKSSSQRSWHLDDFHLCFDIIADLGARVEMGLGWGFLHIYNYIYVCLYSISLSSIHVSLYLMLNFMKTFIGFWHHINRSGMVPSKVSAGSPNKYHLESRWLATPISPGRSWPLTNRHLLGVAIAIYFHHSVIHLFITAMVISTEILSLQIAPC